MDFSRRNMTDEVDQLLLNARLRDEIEPYQDESIECMNLDRLPTEVENQFLASMLAWERAPMTPIAEWFNPQLQLPHPDRLSDTDLHDLLWDTIHKLYAARIVLDFTDHLSDRELYTLILRDILPSPEKRLNLPDHFLHWDCAGDEETYLRFYASEEERSSWNTSDEDDPLPPAERPRHRRDMPGRPL
jgi:hypothetical protein